MSDFLYWKSTEYTQKVLGQLEAEISSCSNDLSSGSLLNYNSQELPREYAKKIGYIEGLKFIERLFHYDDDSAENE
jgi:hypothetical protein